MMETITVSQTSFNGELQQPRLNTKEQQLPISFNTVPKPYNQVTPFTSPYLKTSQAIPERQINFQNRTAEDNEISIFDAQKYFNEGSGQFPNHKIQHSSVTTTDQYDEFPRLSSVSSTTDTYSARNYRGKSFHATPTASSEASWNSQTGLLSNPQGTIKVSLNPVVNKRKNHNPRWFFRSHCPCIGNKSLQVENKTVPSEFRTPIQFRSATSTNTSKQADEEVSTEKSPTENQNSKITSTITITTTSTPSNHKITPEKDSFVPSQQPPLRISLTAGRNYNDGSGFTFPILKPSITSTNNTAEDPPRDSLDVFLPPNQEIMGLKRMAPYLIEDDAASDGSSDLFEIESFTTQTTTYQMYTNNNNNNLRRDSLDEASTFRNPTRLSIITSSTDNYRRQSLEEPATPSVAQTEGYEPSEASIEWSVTTAEGFDRASVTTCDDRMMAAAERDDRGDGRRNNVNRGNGLLGLGCRSEKAVMVGPGPRRVGPTSVPVPQHVGDWIYNKPPLATRPNQIKRG